MSQICLLVIVESSVVLCVFVCYIIICCQKVLLAYYLINMAYYANCTFLLSATERKLFVIERRWTVSTDLFLVSQVLIATTHTHPFNGPLFGTTRVSRYQKGKTYLGSTKVRDSEWQWHHLSHMQVCTSLQTDNHASTPPFSFYRLDGLPATEPIVSKQS